MKRLALKDLNKNDLDTYKDYRLEYNRRYRRDNADKIKISKCKYNKTIKGFLVNTYLGMSARVRGLQPRSPEYKGLAILEKESFYEWALNDPEYLRLHEEWTNSNYNFKLAPSVDRIDNTKGYTMDNIQWLTLSENASKKGGK